jgi:oligopeptide transport system permease protein
VFAFALRRLLAAIPTLFCVILLAFLMMHAAPGGPFDSERALPPDIEANVAAAYHLDEPLPAQFLRYLGGVIKGDFGPSYRYQDYTVSELIAGAFPLSVQVGGLAMLCALVLGIIAGSVAALYRDSAIDRAIMALALTGISIPVFVVAPVLVLVFSVSLSWLPAGWSGANDGSRLVLPVIALALPQLAYISRLLRASLVDVLGSDFIRTAIRKQLDGHVEALGKSMERHTMELGLRDFSRADLEAVQDAGQVLHIKVVGLARIDSDVSAELALATIGSISVLGALQASSEIKAALADRIR